MRRMSKEKNMAMRKIKRTRREISYEGREMK
jgi:hypothetical protein